MVVKTEDEKLLEYIEELLKKVDTMKRIFLILAKAICKEVEEDRLANSVPKISI